jgi:putative intracellular protease/amidase
MHGRLTRLTFALRMLPVSYSRSSRKTMNAILLWGILLCATPLATTAQTAKKVLMILSAADSLRLADGGTYRTGVFLGEFYPTYKALLGAGYAVEFATLGGKTPQIDPESLNEKYWKEQSGLRQEALAFIKESPVFLAPKAVEQLPESGAGYVGLVVPGGQGLMTDLYGNPTVTRLLQTFGQQKKAVGLICHAPSLLLTLPTSDNPFTGFQVNSVSPLEEWFIERFVVKGKPTRRKIARQLKQRGLVYKNGRPGSNFAWRDRYLVTSQNPYSGEAFNRLYLAALEEQR